MRQYVSLVCVFIVVLLAGCAKPAAQITYNPKDFINPNRITDHRVKVHVPAPKVDATFGYGNDPRVEAAFKQFTHGAKAARIQSKGFITYPYNRYAHPIVACEPLHLCVIQLERGEKINDIELGDSAHWLISTALVGSSYDGSYQIAVKPKRYRIATDMVITTNKRTYNVGLVSQPNTYTHVVNFYYPEETLHHAIAALHAREISPLRRATIATSAHIRLNQLNFNYVLKGDDPAWRPTRVFDDGAKTFIQLPAISERLDLPVLYIQRSSGVSLVNYRYKRPYYIVDGLFQRAYLISGKGSQQIKVIIQNENFR